MKNRTPVRSASGVWQSFWIPSNNQSSFNSESLLNEKETESVVRVFYSAVFWCSSRQFFSIEGRKKCMANLKKKRKRETWKKLGSPRPSGRFGLVTWNGVWLILKKDFTVWPFFLCALPSFAASLESLRDGWTGGNDGNNKKNIFKKHITGLFFFKGEFALFSFQLSDLCRLVFGGDSAVFFFGLFFFNF